MPTFLLIAILLRAFDFSVRTIPATKEALSAAARGHWLWYDGLSFMRARKTDESKRYHAI
jgi:hypothetical protein